jgi:hypothetical protein
MPFSIAGMNSRGITPPLMSSTKTKPVPRSLGSRSITQWPYCPRPPVCLMYFALDVGHGAS